MPTIARLNGGVFGGATGAEVLALAEAIRADVRTRFGVALEMEPVLMGR